MSAATAFRDLQAALRALQEELSYLRMAVVEDHPAGDVAFVQTLADHCDDALGWVAEAHTVVERASSTLAEGNGIGAMLAALTSAQHHFDRAGAVLVFDLSTYETVGALLRLGRERRGEWHAWAQSVKGSLDRCAAPLAAAHRAMHACWLEMAQRSVAGTISVHATAINATPVHGVDPAAQAVE